MTSIIYTTVRQGFYYVMIAVYNTRTNDNDYNRKYVNATMKMNDNLYNEIA